METKWITALREAGADTQGALRRFSGNTALYQKFLRMFPQDDTFAQIEPALQASDWAAALAASHTLKGVAGNLGLTPLFDACSNTVSLLRSKDYEKAAESYGALRHAYLKAVEIICLIEEA